MATANATLTTTYTKIADSGAWNLVSYTNANIGMLPRSDAPFIELATSSGVPVATIIGHVVPLGGAMTPATIGDGDLYGRVSVFTAATGRTVVVTVS
jgi:hypothetical protein